MQPPQLLQQWWQLLGGRPSAHLTVLQGQRSLGLGQERAGGGAPPRRQVVHASPRAPGLASLVGERACGVVDVGVEPSPIPP